MTSDSEIKSKSEMKRVSVGNPIVMAQKYYDLLLKNEQLTKDLTEASKYLWAGKRQFAPETTNSDVDVFLDRPRIKLLLGETDGTE